MRYLTRAAVVWTFCLGVVGATALTTVAQANRPPVNTVPGPQTTSEETNIVFSAANGNAISADDPDDLNDGIIGNETVQVSLSSTSGRMTLSSTSGLTFSVGTGTGDSAMTFTGTLSNINAALSGMSFTPNVNFVGSATLTISTNDLGNFGTGGPLTSTSTVSITVNGVNDAPTNTVPGAQSVTKNTSKVFSTANGNRISVSDVDDADDGVIGNETLQVTLSATHGTLTLSSTAALTFSTGTGTGDTGMTFTGTLGNINTALDGMSFTPTANYTGPASLTVLSNDLGNFGSGGPLTSTNTVSMTVSVTTAADITVRGRVLDAGGGGVRGVRVTLTDGNGNVRVTMTNAFGYYTFRSVPSGGTAIVSAVTRGLVFAPRIVEIPGDVSDLNFSPN